MTAPKAMRALYGARAYDAAARARATTVKAHRSPGERPQEICTPPPVLDVLYRAWGGIALDPCGHSDAIVGAEEAWVGHRVDTGRRRKDGSAIMRWDGPGLRTPWRDRTYFNPPFCDLKSWIAHAQKQPARWCGLFPARTNRSWCRALLRTVDGICWLSPLVFVGYAQAHPDRLVLVYRGWDVRALVAATPAALGEWTAPLKAL